MEVEIYYKDKKNSSGVLRGGKIILYISSRLPAAERERHIAELTRRLQARAARAAHQARRIRAGGAGGPVLGRPEQPCTDEELRILADEINRRHYGFAYAGIRFKAQRGLWGSCSLRTRRLYISQRLRAAPRELLEYVVVHELCHLREANHGPRFWALVEKACPDYRERRQILRLWGRTREDQ